MDYKINMLEYCKLILSRVRFNRKIFLKEYRKSFRWLKGKDAHEFRLWAKNEFVRPSTLKSPSIIVLLLMPILVSAQWKKTKANTDFLAAPEFTYSSNYLNQKDGYASAIAPDYKIVNNGPEVTNKDQKVSIFQRKAKFPQKTPGRSNRAAWSPLPRVYIDTTVATLEPTVRLHIKK